MLSVSILCIIAASALFLEKDERIIAALFGLLFMTHEMFLANVPGDIYVLFDAGIALFIIGIITEMKRTEYAQRMIEVLLTVIGFSLVGFLVHISEAPTLAINSCFIALYLYTLAITLNRSTRHAGHTSFDWNRAIYFGFRS